MPNKPLQKTGRANDGSPALMYNRATAGCRKTPDKEWPASTCLRKRPCLQEEMPSGDYAHAVQGKGRLPPTPLVKKRASRRKPDVGRFHIYRVARRADASTLALYEAVGLTRGRALAYGRAQDAKATAGKQQDARQNDANDGERPPCLRHGLAA